MASACDRGRGRLTSRGLRRESSIIPLVTEEMSVITANATAAFINYSNGGWEGNDFERATKGEWATASLNFSGTSFYLYGCVFHPNCVLEVRLKLLAELLYCLPADLRRRAMG